MISTAANAIEFLPRGIQPELIDGDQRFGPLSDIKTVLRDLRVLNIDAGHVRELVEARFLIGFDISVVPGRKCELRVLTKSIEFFRATKGKKYHELEWAKIFRQIVPHQKPIVTGLEIRRGLLCDRGHVENLIIAGQLVALKKSQSGPGGSWTVSRDSYEAFLMGRLQ